MMTLLRAGLATALVILSSYAACAADKPYHRDDLTKAAIRLEDQIKADAGPVTKPVATLRREADAAFARNGQRVAMQSLGQVVALAPNDAANWLRLARAILQIRPGDARERAMLLGAGLSHQNMARSPPFAGAKGMSPQSRNQCLSSIFPQRAGSYGPLPGG